jgi:hypothetical protein
MKLGATDYLLKPFDAKQLATTLENILQGRRLRTEHAQLLEENISYLSERGVFERALSLMSCEGVEALSERLIGALCLETGAQSGALWVARDRDPDCLELAALYGAAPAMGEVHSFDVTGLPVDLREGEARASLRVWHPLSDAPTPGTPALVVTLRHEGRILGLARLTDKPHHAQFSPIDMSAGDKLARFGESALVNALRVRQAECRSLEDPRTGAFSLEYLRVAVGTELGKATRFGRGLSLMKVAWGDPVSGESRSVEDLAAVVQTLRRLLRSTDCIASDGLSGVAVLLSEVDSLGAAVLRRRARRGLLELPCFASLRPDSRPHLAVASFPADGLQLEALERMVDERLEASRARADRDLEDHSIAESLASLLEEGEVDRPERSEQLARFLLGELGRNPGERGLLFLNPGRALAQATIGGLDALRGAAERGLEIAIVAKRAPGEVSEPLLSWIDPERVQGLPPFLIYFGAGLSYALVQDEKPDAEGVRFFHTSDRGVVEHLAFQLQAELAASTPHSASDDDTLQIVGEPVEGP